MSRPAATAPRRCHTTFSPAEVRGILSGKIRAIARGWDEYSTPSPGDIIRVMEGWGVIKHPDGRTEIAYRASQEGAVKASWRPASNMPRDAARLHLRVKDCLRFDASGSDMTDEIGAELGIATCVNPATKAAGFVPHEWIPLRSRATYGEAFAAYIDDTVARGCHGRIIVTRFDILD